MNGTFLWMEYFQRGNDPEGGTSTIKVTVSADTTQTNTREWCPQSQHSCKPEPTRTSSWRAALPISRASGALPTTLTTWSRTMRAATAWCPTWNGIPDGDSSDSEDTSEGILRSDSYVTKYANKHSLESECRHCMSRGAVSMLPVCRPCWPDLRPLRAAARRQHDLCVQILSNDYCPIVAGGTRTSVLYYGIQCYRQRRQADTGYDVLDYVKSLKRIKLKSPLNISYLGVEKYLRLAHVNIWDIHVQVDW